MNTKTQELVTAGYALAKGLDAESAKLVKELATELAVQRVRADELNKQVVNLAVESAGLKELIDQHANCFAVCPNCSHEEPSETDDIIALYRSLETTATDAAIASIQAHGVDKLATFAGKEYQRFVGDKPTQRKWKGIVLLCIDFAAQLRREAGNA